MEDHYVSGERSSQALIEREFGRSRSASVARHNQHVVDGVKHYGWELWVGAVGVAGVLALFLYVLKILIGTP